MPITIKEIEDLLRAASIKFMPAPLPGLPMLISYGTKAGDVRIGLTIGEDGRVVQLRTIGAMKAPDPRYRTALLKAICHASFRRKVARMAFDPSDGEVAVITDIIVADGTLTPKQLGRYVRCIPSIVEDWFPRLKEIVEKGVDYDGETDPETSSEVSLEMVREILERMQRETGGTQAGGRSEAGGTQGPRDAFGDFLDELTSADGKKRG